MNIKPDDLVLEVGSGDKPYPRSDVLLDKLPDDSSEREAGRDLVVDRPLVIGDVEALPFADKSFDYIIASHILEHAKNPKKFLDELSRVGKCGYIETPLPLRERVFDWPFHRWYVYQKDKKLVLIKKTQKSKKFFAGMTQEKRKKLYYLEGKKLLNLNFEWWGEIEYQILLEESMEFLEKLDRELAKTQNLYPNEEQRFLWRKHLKDNLFKVKLALSKKLQTRGGKKNFDLFGLIVCPVCENRLQQMNGKLRCSGCARQYNLFRGKIPQLLP